MVETNAVPWIGVWSGLFLLNALIGIIFLENAWKSLKRFRNPPSKELEELMPAFRRADALKWNKWRLYPGAMTLLVPRMLTLPIFFLVNVFTVKIFMCCHDETKPLKGCRKAVIRFAYRLCWRVIGCFSLFTWHSVEYLTEE